MELCARFPYAGEKIDPTSRPEVVPSGILLIGVLRRDRLGARNEFAGSFETAAVARFSLPASPGVICCTSTFPALLRLPVRPPLVAQYHPSVHVYALSRHVTCVFRSKERRHLGNLFWCLLAA